MIKIRAQGHENFAYLLHLFGEVGVTVTEFAGGNEFYVPDDTVVDDDEIRVEIAAAVRPGTLPDQFAPRPPGGSGDPAPVEASPEQEQVDLPPRSGPGSGRKSWVQAAETRGLTVTDDMTRDQIAELVEARDDR